MKKRPPSVQGFGKRLAHFRKARGLTQTELGNKIGVSKRVLSYYERKASYPPAHLLIPIAKALRVSVDELLGLKKADVSKPEHAALWRKLRKAEQLSKKDRKTLVDFIDALVTRSRLRHAS